MHESNFFKNTLVIVKLKLVIFFCFCNGELLYSPDIVGLLHIKHDQLYRNCIVYWYLV